MHLILLALAAFGAGLLNAIAGGGSFLTLPALIFAGIPPVVSNATSTVALFPASFASAFSYRNDIRRLQGVNLKLWLIVSIAGGLTGAILLMRTSDHTFLELAPWLLLFATILFAFGRQISAAIRKRMHFSEQRLLVGIFVVSVYGGYFGGGMGIMILALFALYGLTDINAMNGIKAILGGSLNAMAVVVFIMAHQISWTPALVMMIASIVGGYAGGSFARRLPAVVIRYVVIALGCVMTAKFFLYPK